MYKTHECDVKILADNLSEKEAFSLEKEYIYYIKNNTNFRLTNQTDGGEGNSGFHPSDEVKKKISNSMKEKWKDADFKSKMDKIRNDPNGAYRSNEFRNKISKIVQGKNNPNYMHHWTDSQKTHLSLLKKGKHLKSENGNAKKVVCLETGEIFDCIENAAVKCNIKCPSSISLALKEDVRTAANFHWKYYQEELEDESYRKDVLIDILHRSNNKKSFICLETNQIFLTKKDLMKHLGLSTKIFSKYMNDNCLSYDNKNYVLIKKLY